MDSLRRLLERASERKVLRNVNVRFLSRYLDSLVGVRPASS